MSGFRILFAAVAGLGAAAAWADDFDDFRIPAHRVTDWTANFSAVGNRSSFAQSDVDERQRYASGLARSSFRWLGDSDPVFTAASLSAFASPQGQWSSVDEPISFGRRQVAQERRDLREGWSASVTHRRYPWSVPLGLSLAAVGTGDYNQRWSRYDTHSMTDDGVTRTRALSRIRNEEWHYRYALSADVTVGWGRVRDATGVYDAMILEQRLRETGAISRSLSAEARRRMMALLVVRREFAGVHDRPAKHLWDEIERILREDGALREGDLDGYSVQRAGESVLGGGLSNEGVPRSPVQRLVGFFVGPTLSTRNSEQISRLESGQFSQDVVDDVPQPPVAFDTHVRSRNTFDDVLGGIAGEAHRPLGSRWQLDAATSLFVPLRGDRDGFTATTRSSVSMIVADRWSADASLSYTRVASREEDITLEDAWTWSYGFGATWYVEDRLGLDVDLIEYQGHDSRAFGPSGRSGQIRLGLSYRFLGTFDAPDLELGRRLP